MARRTLSEEEEHRLVVSVLRKGLFEKTNVVAVNSISGNSHTLEEMERIVLKMIDLKIIRWIPDSETNEVYKNFELTGYGGQLYPDISDNVRGEV